MIKTKDPAHLPEREDLLGYSRGIARLNPWLPALATSVAMKLTLTSAINKSVFDF